MKWIFTLFLFTAFTFNLNAQVIAHNYMTVPARTRTSIPAKVNLNGQWRGTFDENTNNISALYGDAGSESTTYVLELEVQDNKISGYSYTYFSDGLKRYYTICRVIGTVDRKTNSIIVTEVERTRYNTPPYIQNCFQIHRLSYEKGPDNTEYLKGDWVPAPDQVCTAVGKTVLSRQKMTRTPFAIKIQPKKPDVAKTQKPQTTQKPSTERLKKEEPKPAAPESPATAQIKKTVITGPIHDGLEPSADLRNESKTITIGGTLHKGYERRENVIVRSINIESSVIQVDFYDNGIIDGDSISVFYNDKLILSNKMLTAKPLTLTVSIDKKKTRNIITMYADNLGSIPPNTAVMIVRDGSKRYEVRMESDLKKSSSVEFTHKANQ